MTMDREHLRLAPDEPRDPGDPIDARTGEPLIVVTAIDLETGKRLDGPLASVCFTNAKDMLNYVTSLGLRRFEVRW